jgi:hypothetical protein
LKKIAMILTPHLLLGAAIASLLNNHFLAGLLAFTSHYFLDAIPHYDYSVNNIKEKNWRKSLPELLKIALDCALSVALLLLLAKNFFQTTIIASFAVLPDGITFFQIILPPNRILKAHSYLHHKVSHWHKNKKISLFWKISSQVAVVVLAVLVLIQ